MNRSNFVRISVGIITYKQEQLVGRMIESVIKQKDFGLQELIICDDSSPDGTWDVILDYQQRYPDIIKPYRNNQNKGIYGNLAVEFELLHKCETDIITFSAGDDEFCDGLFASIQQSVKDNHVDCQNESAAFYCDWKITHPNGKERICKQNILLSGENPIDLHIKKLLNNRPNIITKKCFDRFEEFPFNQGLSISEVVADMQQYLHSDKNYYIPVVGSVYYAGIGVSTTLNNPNDIKNRLEARKYTLDNYKLEKTTRHFVLYQIYLLTYQLKGDFGSYTKSLVHYVKSHPNLNVVEFAKQIKIWISRLIN